MKIYTRAGDAGETGLFGGGRLGKDDPRVEAVGTVDETNAALGLARAAGAPEDVDRTLERVQTDLFQIGAELACVAGKEPKLGTPLVSSEDVAWVEHRIDESEAQLAPLRSFVLPAGTAGAAQVHLARTVCRRAERRVVALGRQVPVRTDLVVYLNRLSDLLFVLARRCNHAASVPDVPWVPRSSA